jgi:hypothetical protein
MRRSKSGPSCAPVAATGSSRRSSRRTDAPPFQDYRDGRDQRPGRFVWCAAIEAGGEIDAPKLVGARRFCHRAPFKYQPTYKPGSVGRSTHVPRVTAIPLGRRLPGASSNLPGRPDPDTDPELPLARAFVPSLFGLAPGGVCHAADVAADAVRSYRTLSPLPRRYATCRGGLLSVALSLKPHPVKGSAPPDVIRHRTSVEPGLSSPATFRSLPERPSSRLTPFRWTLHRAPSTLLI